VRTRDDATKQGKHTKKWVRKEVETLLLFHPIKERDMYKKVRKELIGVELIASTPTVPPLYERLPCMTCLWYMNTHI
jgi:hypothetical protein